MRDARVFILLIVTLLWCFGSELSASAQVLPVTIADLPYDCTFSKEYIVAGGRTLNVTIRNNSSHHITALEIEIRLRDPFGEVISDWIPFLNPDLEIRPAESRTIGMKLTKQNILGAVVESPLERARYADLRYKKILLKDGQLITQRQLYPELQSVFGSFRVQARTIQDALESDNGKSNLAIVREDVSSNAHAIMKKEWGMLYDLYKKTTEEIAGVLGNECILLRVYAANISEAPIIRDWSSRSESSPITLIDDAGNQYSTWAVVFAPQPAKTLVNGQEALMPGASMLFYYVFDKLDGYSPKTVEVYIDGIEYEETLMLK